MMVFGLLYFGLKLVMVLGIRVVDGWFVENLEFGELIDR